MIKRYQSWIWWSWWWWSLQWLHNEHNGVSNHRRINCLLNRLFRRRCKKTNVKTQRHWPLWGEPLVTGGFPSQRANYADNVSIWWRHHGWWWIMMDDDDDDDNDGWWWRNDDRRWWMIMDDDNDNDVDGTVMRYNNKYIVKNTAFQW